MKFTNYFPIHVSINVMICIRAFKNESFQVKESPNLAILLNNITRPSFDKKELLLRLFCCQEHIADKNISKVPQKRMFLVTIKCKRLKLVITLTYDKFFYK